MIDDGLALAVCGTGACVSTGSTCNPSSCTPGTATTESCDGIDNNCNGAADEGDLCPLGENCIGGACVRSNAGDDAGADALADVEPDSVSDSTPDSGDALASGIDAGAGNGDAAAPQEVGNPGDAVPTSDRPRDPDVATTPDANPPDADQSPDAAIAEDTTTAVPRPDARSADVLIVIETGAVADASRGDARDGSVIAEAAAGGDTGEANGEQPSDNGCTCRIDRHRHPQHGIWLVALGAAAALARLRRRKGA
jgi:MYXO-CTERM domain-containing protein